MALEPVEVFNFQYSADSSRIFFLYQRLVPGDAYERTYGGVCYFTLGDGSLECPSDDFHPLQVMAPHTLLLSPDEHFAAYTGNYYSSFADEGGSTTVNVIGIEAASFFHLGFPGYYEDRWMTYGTSTLLWRPAVQP